jgi:molybdopterin-guanine dinucleotide biosynthesis protein A
MEDSRTDTTPREIIALAMHAGMKSLKHENVFLTGCQPPLDAR